MIKRTLYFSNPVYLKTKDEQLVFNLPNAQGLDDLGQLNVVPIEDIGIVILDHQQITLTHSLMAKLLANNVALITCDATHHPTGLMLNLDGNTLQSAHFQAQLEAALPLKKQLWQQTIKAKIHNQAAHLKKQNISATALIRWRDEVKSGDIDNQEGKAAAYYWKNLFGHVPNFTRYREGPPPNALLNYGYSILRAATARSLVGSGLLPTLGIHHHNQYNAYCLADDIMEPYRPFVDMIVYGLVESGEDFTEVNKDIKKALLSIPAMDVVMNGEKSPLMVGLQRTTASLARCFEGKEKKIVYPEF